ncbi:MAG: helix-turn-helix transcriptional regulator [Cellulosilyticaceae bacterium]
MKINQIIKEKRNERGLTQEQIAEYLGVSTPAVNKWEKGNNYPDITLLPPLARLLKIDLNTLLSFNEDLTDQEIGLFTNELFTCMSSDGFEAGFEMGLDKIREYPTCDKLILTVITMMRGSLVMFGVTEKGHYEAQINHMFEQLTKSENIEVRYQAISLLIGQHIEDKNYEVAQQCIDQLPNMIDDKLQQQGELYMKMNQLDKASELFENRVINTGTELFRIFIYMIEIAVKEGRLEDAKYFAEIVEKMNTLFDLWDYNTYVTYFQLYTKMKDVENCIATLKKMLPALRKKWDISNSRLYTHIKMKQTGTETEEAEYNQFYTAFVDMLRNDPENELDFIKNRPEFIELLKE